MSRFEWRRSVCFTKGQLIRTDYLAGLMNIYDIGLLLLVLPDHYENKFCFQFNQVPFIAKTFDSCITVMVKPYNNL
uniref:Uncharacterized protein n=1 Tax=Panagrellus redivivus TaxID=6233 RepID=A0A7E4V833_PANRE